MNHEHTQPILTRAMRAKFQVTKVTKHPCACEQGTSSVELEMSPVCPSKFGPKGEHEDNDFHRWSPSGHFKIMITNPALVNRFEEGQKYYMDFTLAEADPAPAEQPL